MSFLREALKGAKADVDSAGHELLPRLGRAARVAGILGAELAAIVALAPYGAYAMSVYRRLTAFPPLPPPSMPQKPQKPSPTGARVPASTAAESAAPATAVERLQGPAAAAAAVAADLPADPPQQQPFVHQASALRQLPHGRYGVAVHREVSYGPAPRNTLDVYVPLAPEWRRGAPAAAAAASLTSAGPGPASLPVAFFVHGGVWASGETWQYSPMATRLAQAGLVVVVPTYTLYPEALAGTMVEEVSAALSWTFDNAARYGGDPARITAVGHSAGGHLVAWALLRRAAAAAATAAAAASGSIASAAAAPPPPLPPPPDGGSAQQEPRRVARLPCGGREDVRQDLDEQPQGSAAHSGDRRDTAAYLLGGGGMSLPGVLHALRTVADAQLHPQPGVDLSYDDGGAAATASAAAAAPAHVESDTRMPTLFVGMSAVYDIAKHYEFEKSRAVHELSMMKRAVGGPAGFAAASPSVILARAADAAATGSRDPAAAAAAASGGGGAGSHFTSYFTSFELLGDAIPARAGLNGPDGNVGTTAPAAVAAAAPAFNLAAAARLPPFVVMGSCSDHMVPWHEGAELAMQLRRCGVPVRHLLYNHVGHGDFVMAWRPLKSAHVTAAAVASSAGEPDNELHLEGLLPCARDLLRIATGRVRPFPSSLSPSSSLSSPLPVTFDEVDGDAAAAAARAGELAEGPMLARSRL